MSTNQIGLVKAEITDVIEKLNSILSSYHIFYSNVRGYHWNVKGQHFFSLHEKFEELYTSLQVEIDEIAERILTLSGTPFHAYSDFAVHGKIAEDKNVHEGNQCVEGVVTGLQTLIEEQRSAVEVAERAEDQGTADLLAEYIQQQEKLVWMYNAFLGK